VLQLVLRIISLHTIYIHISFLLHINTTYTQIKITKNAHDRAQKRIMRHGSAWINNTRTHESSCSYLYRGYCRAKGCCYRDLVRAFLSAIGNSLCEPKYCSTTGTRPLKGPPAHIPRIYPQDCSCLGLRPFSF